jgi:hypothetical protein
MSVCRFCMQNYSFTPILMKFCALDLQNKKKITVYFNFTKTNPYYHFQPCSSWKYPHLRRFTPILLSIWSPSPLDTHKKQPLLSFLSLLSNCKIALVLVKHHLRSCLHLLLFVRFVQHLTFR